MSDMRIAVMGAAGRMGRELIRAVHATPGCVVAGGTEVPGSSAIGLDLGELAGVGPLGVKVSGDPVELAAGVDAIIDFTIPRVTVDIAALAANARIVHVIGTTGLS
jgi:4-hydroxy-tetrahydrodipicolinate reductase